MKLWSAIRKLFEKRRPTKTGMFVEDQFKELVKRNLSIPVKLYHL